jgi:hypothetical protein
LHNATVEAAVAMAVAISLSLTAPKTQDIDL